jgi:hypothetical protein
MKGFLAFGAVVVALTASGCGGSSEASAGGDGTTTSSREDAQLAFAQCLREHGIEVSDPGTQGGGGIRLAIRPGNETKFREAQQECRKQVPGAFPELTDEQEQQFRDAALRFARCMREHGVDVPDPKFGSGGGFMIQGARRDDPDFRDAQKACARLLPRRGEARP